MRYRSAGAGHPLKGGDGRRLDGSRAGDRRRSLGVRQAQATDARRPRGNHAADARSLCGDRAEDARRTSWGAGWRAAQRRKRHVPGACRSRAPDRGTRVHGSTVRLARKDGAGMRRFPPSARRAPHSVPERGIDWDKGAVEWRSSGIRASTRRHGACGSPIEGCAARRRKSPVGVIQIKILFSANGSNERTKRNLHPFYLQDYKRFTPEIIPQTAFNPP